MASSAAKGDRLALPRMAALAPAEPSGPDRTRSPAASLFEPSLLDPFVTAPSPAPRVQGPAVAARETPRAERKPFRCTRAGPVPSDLLASAQIARIKATLNLSPEQEKHWGRFESALKEMGRQLQGDAAGTNARKVLSAERTQQLYWTAGPLVLSLSDEQKREARNLACSLGLKTVAALI